MVAKCRGMQKRTLFRSYYYAFPSQEAENAVCIPLTKGKHAIIDADMYDVVCDHRWRTSKGYAFATIFGKNVGMHGLIANTPQGYHTDHINHNPLDNRRSNLRACTATQNFWNVKKRAVGRNKYLGVFKHKDGKYQASIRVNNKLKHIGLFANEIEAAIAYDKMVREIRGEYGYTNF